MRILQQMMLKTESLMSHTMTYAIMLFESIFFGIGVSCSIIVPKLIKEYVDDENKECFVYQIMFLGIFNIIYIIIDVEGAYKSYSFGIGLTPITPIFTIGWRK